MISMFSTKIYYMDNVYNNIMIFNIHTYFHFTVHTNDNIIQFNNNCSVL